MKPKKLCTSATILGTSHSLMAVIFFGSVSIPPLETMCPKQAIHDLKNSHLLGLSHSPAADNFSNTPLNLSTCSSGVLENTMISSR